jgi:hypothetical protein
MNCYDSAAFFTFASKEKMWEWFLRRAKRYAQSERQPSTPDAIKTCNLQGKYFFLLLRLPS